MVFASQAGVNTLATRSRTSVGREATAAELYSRLALAPRKMDDAMQDDLRGALLRAAEG